MNLYEEKFKQQYVAEAVAFVSPSPHKIIAQQEAAGGPAGMIASSAAQPPTRVQSLWMSGRNAALSLQTSEKKGVEQYQGEEK